MRLQVLIALMMKGEHHLQYGSPFMTLHPRKLSFSLQHNYSLKIQSYITAAIYTTIQLAYSLHYRFSNE
jgi:hypothetical protein